MPIDFESVQSLVDFIDGGYGRREHSKCCAIDSVTTNLLMGILETFPDSEYTVDNYSVDAFFPLEL
jgi:hypothetical protein